MKTLVEISFHASKIPGGADAILGPSQCGSDVAKRIESRIENYFEQYTSTRVELKLDNDDERVSKVFTLLAAHGIEPLVFRKDIYTEDELQSARLLNVGVWGNRLAGGGRRCGTTYDMSNACPKCGAGARQTSPLIIDGDDVRRIENLRIAATYHDELLLHDVDVERLLAENVTGALFWPIHAKSKQGNLTELRRQQVLVQHVMPPMSPRAWLDRTKECAICHRSGFTSVADWSTRFIYREEDLANIQDFNLTWEFFGEFPDFHYNLEKIRWPDPTVLVTPKVMNLLRAKTKKEAKYQGADFIPIWIDDEKA